MAVAPQRSLAPQAWADQVIEGFRESTLLRTPRERAGGSVPRAVIDGREAVVFSSNDYLGLSAHPAVRRAAADAALCDGVGSTGSRLLSGAHEALRALEHEIAAFIEAEDAVVAPSGYAANVAALVALSGPGTAIFSDELNHASIVDGCRLSRSSVHIYRHRDMQHLEALLASCGERRLIVSDSVFSTDGTAADVAALAALAERFDAWLVLDEAHATGVLGPAGRGAAVAASAQSMPQLVRVITFSKALGASGAAVCGSSDVRQLLLQRGRALIYSTAPPHPSIAAVRAALRVLEAQPGLVLLLHERAHLMHALLEGLTASARHPDVPIDSVLLGDAPAAMQAEQALLERGFLVQALRPPTVPRRTSRLRVVVTAAHEEVDIRGVAVAIRDVMR